MLAGLLGLGNQEAALDWLERALEERSGWLDYMNVEPSMDRIRSPRRFQELLRRVALPG